MPLPAPPQRLLSFAGTAGLQPCAVTYGTAAPRSLLLANMTKLATPQLLFRDLATGAFRVFAYGVNATGSTIACVVTARNGGSSTATVTVTRQGSAAGSDPFGVGAKTASAWLATQATAVPVPPGHEATLLTGAFGVNGTTFEAVLDGSCDQPLAISAYAVAPGQNYPQTFVPQGSEVTRGTFQGADLAVSVAVPAGGAWLGFPPPPWLGVSTFSGVSALDGGRRAGDSGAWGFAWTLSLQLPSSPKTVLAYAPDAGAQHGSTAAFAVGGTPVVAARSGTDLHAGTAASFWSAEGALTVLATPTGGSYYPGAMLFLPAAGSGYQALALGGAAALAVGGAVLAVERGHTGSAVAS